MCNVSVAKWRIENRGGLEDADTGLQAGEAWKETTGSTTVECNNSGYTIQEGYENTRFKIIDTWM